MISDDWPIRNKRFEQHEFFGLWHWPQVFELVGMVQHKTLDQYLTKYRLDPFNAPVDIDFQNLTVTDGVGDDAV